MTTRQQAIQQKAFSKRNIARPARSSSSLSSNKLLSSFLLGALFLLSIGNLFVNVTDHAHSTNGSAVESHLAEHRRPGLGKRTRISLESTGTHFAAGERPEHGSEETRRRATADDRPHHLFDGNVASHKKSVYTPNHGESGAIVAGKIIVHTPQGHNAARVGANVENMAGTPANPVTSASVFDQPRVISHNLIVLPEDEPPMEDVSTDPLRASNFGVPRGKIDLQPATPYLGVLLDAGRHYFPVVWIKRMIDRLQDMNYNLLHFRLTDDQAFNVMLKSHPELAYPSAANNPDRLVYTVEELRDITAYAKDRGIRIMPEINVPGHAGSWAGGRPDLIIHCPKFLCDKGYGLPLNISHPDLFTILENVLTEVIDIFDDPPFLHLGGDEVSMSKPCFAELGLEMFNYQEFEDRLKMLLNKIKYPEHQVARWEMTGGAKYLKSLNLHRAGSIEQFWESHPGVRHDASGPFFVSTWLYFDTNGDQTAFDVYEKTRVNFSLKKNVFPTAIIAGTFELSTEFWYDRNVLGKLLAVAIASSNDKSYHVSPSKIAQKKKVLDDWGKYCQQLGFGDAICDTSGMGVISHGQYLRKWDAKWNVFRQDMCSRLSDFVGKRNFPVNRQRDQARSSMAGNDFFWRNFPLELPVKDAQETQTSAIPPGWESILGSYQVQHVGAILDVTGSMVVPARLSSIVIDFLARLGFNFVQLPLVNNNGFVYDSHSQASLMESLLASKMNPHYSLDRDLAPLIQKAKNHGITIVPEVSVSTDAAGWYKAGYMVKCPEHFCSGKGLPLDISRPNVLPILYSVIAELYKAFGGPFIHLGSDERDATLDCFAEAGDIGIDSFDRFEAKLTKMLEMTGISPNQILRWENSERKRYSNRTGDITHYRANTEDLKASPDSPFFVTVDIFRGDGWSVYQQTRDLVALNPTGILAEIRTLTQSRWIALDVTKRLIAFALGVSSQGSIKSSADFEEKFVSLCEALKWSRIGDCSSPEAPKEAITFVTDRKEFVEQHCNLRTVSDRKYTAKKPVRPFYLNATVYSNGALTFQRTT